jgi:hypothetical protein
MIISASRRTDIPTYYSDWFYNRIKEGYVLVRNPMNVRQISRIELTPDVVDGIVFWTKNPLPMLDRLGELKDYTYYFQFTVTPYGKDVEPNPPLKIDGLPTAFKRLSDTIGADRIVWRYDPVLISERYSLDYHIRAFAKLARGLRGCTRKVTVSFIDADYRGVKNNLKELALLDFPTATQTELSSAFADIAHGNGLTIDTCAEKTDLSRFGIDRARCVDDRLFARLLDCRLILDKDKTQRPDCGCAASIDIGMYNTCLSGCRYCYANYDASTVSGNFTRHNPLSPLLSGEIESGDKITEREVKSCKDAQLRFEMTIPELSQRKTI